MKKSYSLRFRGNWKVGLLSFCYALSSTSASLNVLAATLVGYHLAEVKTWATIPLSLQLLGTMAASFPASMLMKRVGRRNGFLLGTALGVFGAFLCAFAIKIEHFPLFCLGVFCLGLMRGISQLFRFTAVEVVEHDFHAQAISLVLAGGIIAGFLGPAIGSWTADWIPYFPFAGSYLVIAVLFLTTVPVLFWMRLPGPTLEERSGPSRALKEIVRQPLFLIAVLSSGISYGVMALIMTATPLAMTHGAHGVDDAAIVIQWHVVGMFAPSFFTGNLIRRFGHMGVMTAGLILNFVCVGINLIGEELLHFWTALLLLGVGWNFMYVSGTSLLTRCYRSAEKAQVQGFNDFLVFASAALFSMLAGVMQTTQGWSAVNLYSLPLLAFAGFMLIRFRALKTTY